MKQDLKSMTLAEMQDAFAAIGEPKFRAKQVFTWLHRGAVSFDAMTNLSKPLREKLDGLYYITAPSVARKQVSKLDGTIKYLWKLRDGNCVESVVMQYHHGNTVCISSEVGCPMGCKFCASTIGGLVRRLEPSELVDQVLFSQLDSGLPISNIVLMGIGEPLDNFDNVMRFLELINSPDGMNIGMRHISLSTCGLVDKIEKLAERDLQLTLSVSLHSPDDESRSKIMPVNRIATKADLKELLANLPYKTYEKRKEENPNQPVERITIVCMGHEPDLKGALEQELIDYKLDIQIVDILRDKKDLQLKRDSEAEIVREGSKLVIRAFYPMNLMQKLSLQKEYVEDWRQLVDSVMIDWNYDGVVMQPAVADVPGKNEMVAGVYDIPEGCGTIKVKITDLLSESLEVEVR
mgnify:FL=1